MNTTYNKPDDSKHSLKSSPKLSIISNATDSEQTPEFDRLTWLDSEEAASYLRKTANALRIMVYRGYIRPRRFRRRLYFRKIELDRLLESSNF